jgi:4a-hydroxytetrahydrobiopterin dehydratase
MTQQGAAILDERQLEQALRELPGWERTGHGIAKAFAHDDFRSAMLFLSRVAEAAEALGQHPDIDVRGTRTTLAIGPQGGGGLSGDAVALAHRIERLVGDHHHRPGMAGP